MDLNTVTLVGTLTETPEAQEVGYGGVVVDLELAVTEHVKCDDEWQHVPFSMTVAVSGKQAQACVEHLHEGAKVGISGRLSRDDLGLKVIAHNVQFLSPVEEPVVV